MPSLDWNSDRYKNIGKDETCNEDIVKTSLTNTDFLKIVDDGKVYYGGNQNWFQKYTQSLEAVVLLRQPIYWPIWQ